MRGVFAAFAMILVAAWGAAAAEVTNVRSRVDGNQVVIIYDLDAKQFTAVSVRGSDDGGKYYRVKMEHVSGDVGESVPPGTNCRIVWDVLRDYPEGLGSRQVVFQILAGSTVDARVDHVDSFARLPAEYFMPYRTEKYSACFECHSAELSLTESTREVTEFRNGDHNLHFLHVNKEKGRSCKSCHTTETEARQEKLMRDWVPFGKTHKLPVKFTKTATGGGCVVGCHKPKDYDRVNPVVY